MKPPGSTRAGSQRPSSRQAMRRGMAAREIPPGARSAFTLVEVIVGMVLLTTLFIACFSAICSMKIISSRTSDYTAAMALAEAKIQDIRATAYPGTNNIFSNTATTTNVDSVSVYLNQAATSFLVPGTVISTIAPMTWGHLVTVTVVVQEPGLPLTNTLQTVVNEYSGGRGQ